MDTNPTTDKQLVERCQQNDDAEAFGELYARHFFNTKYKLASHTGVSEHDANDIVQKSFIKAMHRIKSFRNVCEFATWIYRISYNTFLDSKRAQKMFCSLEESLVDGVEQPEREETIIYDNPASIMCDRDNRENIAQKIEDAKLQLTPNQRKIFEMIFIERLSYQEVSDKINCPIGTVMSRVHFARKKLKEFLNKELETA